MYRRNSQKSIQKLLEDHEFIKQLNILHFPPDDLINPPEKDDRPPPLGQFWIYTCPKCGGKMSTYMDWCSITPAPIICSKCGYTIQGKMEDNSWC